MMKRKSLWKKLLNMKNSRRRLPKVARIKSPITTHKSFRVLSSWYLQRFLKWWLLTNPDGILRQSMALLVCYFLICCQALLLNWNNSQRLSSLKLPLSINILDSLVTLVSQDWSKDNLKVRNSAQKEQSPLREHTLITRILIIL